MIRIAVTLAALFVVVAHTHAAGITLKFSGTIQSVVDANASGSPPIDFTPIPAGSTFTGTYTYDTDSPSTGGGTGFTRYSNLLASGGSFTINGIQFTSAASGSAIVVSQEAGFGYSGLAVSTQPIVLPEGWSVANSSLPYFTFRLEDATPQARSLALPATEADFATAKMDLIVDFQQPVTVDGQDYGGRVDIQGEITSLSVIGPVPPPQEVAIDVVPSSRENKVNLNPKKPKPLEVAVLGAANFDVLDIVPETIELGDPVLTDGETGTGQNVGPTTIAYEDVNGDGELDLLLTFDLSQLQDVGGINYSSTSLEFQALLENDGVVYGSDVISIPGSPGKAKK